MGYYDLAREARARLARATSRHDNTARELWKDRLADLGVRVAGALVEMEDLTGAAAHLASLTGGGGEDGTTTILTESGRRLAMAKALLWLHLGDVEAARRCVDPKEVGERADKVITALCHMAEGQYGEALSVWETLKDEADDEMVGVNMAVCLLYVGKMQEVCLFLSLSSQPSDTLSRVKSC
jgi:hypothetical protein